MSDNTEMEKYFFRASAENFKKIPGEPIAYWVGENVRDVFSKNLRLSALYKPVQGLITGDTERFAKNWHEVRLNKICLGKQIYNPITLALSHKWFPYNKGGSFRKWFGNNEFVVNWENDGAEVKSFKDGNGRLLSRPQNESTYFKEGLTWTAISSSYFAVRYCPPGSIGSNAGMMIFSDELSDLKSLIGMLNSIVSAYLMSCLSQTLNFDQGIISKIPVKYKVESPVIDRLIESGRLDWDSYETSWDFTTLPLLAKEHRQATLAETYQTLRQHWLNTTIEMQRLEEENNRIFIDAYGLQDELTPDVPLKEITLTCNPYYRYGKEAEQQGKEYPLDTKLEERLRLDTMAEFISYAVGCMFGRYSLDKEGLVLANQGESLADYLAQVPNPSFEIDDDNVIPILDADWFADDIVERFRKFLRVTFGDAHFSDNLAFIEKALGKDVRSYFLKDFYNDHVQRYKKRPIYWMFSSPKGSFNALIYMHRYRPDTVSVVLNDYLREFRTKLEAQIKYQEAVEASSSASPSDKTKALKEIDRLKKVLIELDDYERDTLYPLATQQLTIDLDDGVKVNYPKFGNALKKIVGL